ncbi:Acetyltransferase (GNAT) domain-containing protein [Sphingobium faniae]|nr:Acetyltransferase (GNAT) domain-containing protein [Sphingobium faniae]
MAVTREYRSFAEVRPALAGRLDRTATPCLFDRIDWFESLHHHCFADRFPHVLRVTEGDAELWLFLLPSDARRLSALANWYSFAWRPIFLGAPASSLQAQLLEVAARHLLGRHAQMDFYPVQDESGQMLAAFRRAGWFAVRRPMGGRHLLQVNGRDFMTYWAQRPGHLRSQVRRKGRGAPFAIEISDRLTDALWNDYQHVHARSWKEAEPGLSFLRALADRESAAGRLRMSFARREGMAVATQFWTVENGVALIHKLSHDQAFDHASPGTLLSHAMFAHAIDLDRVSMIDYGTGDNAYKRDWMDERATLHRIDCFNPRHASTWFPAARTAISALVG